MKLILTLTAAIALSAMSFAQNANPFSMSSKDADKPIGISADTILADVKNQTATWPARKAKRQARWPITM
jgi:hypothetical protein